MAFVPHVRIINVLSASFSALLFMDYVGIVPSITDRFGTSAIVDCSLFVLKRE